MAMITVEQFYEKFIKPMAVTERLQLVALITHELAAELPPIEAAKVVYSPELGAQAGSNIAAYEYISELPEEQKGSPEAVLQLAGTLPPEEADAILQAAQTARRIDWEMWK